MKAAIIGAGGMGGVHAVSCRTLPDLELVAVNDLRPEAAHKLAGKYGAKVASADEIFDDDSIELVIVTTSTESHMPLSIRALEAGKHVFCEKPIARRVDEAIEMVEVARRAPGKATVGHVVCFCPEYAAIKRLLDEGKIGTPAVVRTERNGSVPVVPDNWFMDFDRSGGVICDLAIHDIDFCLACFGPVKRVYAKGLLAADSTIEIGDHALVTLRFEQGLIAHIEASWLYGAGFYMAFEAAGSAGIIEYDSRDTRPLVYAPSGAVAKERIGAELPESPYAESSYTMELRLFIEAIQQDTEPPITFEYALNVLRVAEAAERSAATGKAVEL